VDFIVLSSSRGTTFQAVLDAEKRGELEAKCLGLLTDRADRECIAKAEAAGVPVWIVEWTAKEKREIYDRRVMEALQDMLKGRGPRSVVLAALGWMHIVGPAFIHEWRHRILNVHPALLPKFGGEGMYGMRVHEAVLDHQEKESGITIHLMDEGVDTGPILLQKTCPVLPGDSPETLRDRIQALEREWYPKTLQMIHRGEVKLPE
jgi:phosphoribosylglycinamide formyltransferase 1